MHRIDTDGAVSNLFNPGDPLVPRNPTQVDEHILNAFQEEICRVVEGGGLALVKDRNTQLNEAIMRHLATFGSSNWFVGSGGAAGATAVAMHQTLLPGAGNTVAQAVVVGTGGMIQSSTDGKVWTNRTSGTANDLMAITHNGSLWVAVGGTGAGPNTGTVLTSPDGITWTVRTSTLTVALLRTVSWSASLSLFVAAGDGGYLATSPTGTTWTTRTSNLAAAINSSVFANGIWFAATSTTTGGANATTSTDGINWTARTVGANGIAGVTYGGSALGGSQFVLLNTAASPLPYTSTDAITWTAGTALPSGTVTIHPIAWNGRQYLTYSGGAFVASIDGAVWKLRPSEDVTSTGTFKVATNPTTGMFVTVDAAIRYNSLKHPPN